MLLQMAIFCFLWLSNIPLCMSVCVCVYVYIYVCVYVYVYMYVYIPQLFFILSFVDGWLDCFCILPVVNSAL